MSPNLTKGDKITFSLIKAGIFGNGYTDVMVCGVVDYLAANAIDRELGVKHAAFFPYFKDIVGNVDNPSVYEYVLINTGSGDPIVIGKPWIDEATLRHVSTRTARFTIFGYEERHYAPIVDRLKNMGLSFTFDEVN